MTKVRELFHSKCDAEIDHMEQKIRRLESELGVMRDEARKQRDKVNIQTYIAMLKDTVQNLNFVLERLEGQS